MNIFRFSIEISRGIRESNPITQIITNKFSENTQHSGNYSTEVSREWDRLKLKNLKIIYENQRICAYNKTQNITYFIISINRPYVTDIKKISLDVIVISEIDDPDHSTLVVINDIKRIMRKKISFLTNSKVSILDKNPVYLHPFNESDSDIEIGYHITADFKKYKIDKWNKFMILLIFLTLLISFIVYFFGGYDNNINNILIGIISSSFVFLLVEIAIKILPLTQKKVHIFIKNLTSFIKPPFITNIFSSNEEGTIKTPVEDAVDDPNKKEEKKTKKEQKKTTKIASSKQNKGDKK